MPVVVRCTSCHKRVGVPEQAVGRQVRCPLCQAVFVARPDADEDLPIIQPLATPPPPPHAVRAATEPITVAPAPAPKPLPPQRPQQPPPKKKFPWAVALGGGVTVVALVTVVLLIAVGAFSGPAIPDDAWQEYRSEPGRFSVLLPGVPAVKELPGAGTATVLYDGRYDFHVSHAELIGRDPRELAPRPDGPSAGGGRLLGTAGGGILAGRPAPGERQQRPSADRPRRGEASGGPKSPAGGAGVGVGCGVVAVDGASAGARAVAAAGAGGGFEPGQGRLAISFDRDVHLWPLGK